MVEIIEKFIKAISLSQCRAEAEKFRAVTWIDSEPYQIGEDQATLDDARLLCVSGSVGEQPVAVFDDKGVMQVT